MNINMEGKVSPMAVVAKLDEYGKAAWIGVMVLGFIVFWPIGLALLAFLLWSGRMGCWGKRGPGRWYFKDETSKRRESWRSRHGAQSSGNSAFDEYREETLRRLEDEQKEFIDFLERLRHAKDKAEFDEFMADRKRRQDQAATEGGDSDAESPGGSYRRPPEGGAPSHPA